MDDDDLPGLVVRGKSMLERAMRLADACNAGSDLGSPSDWIHNSEHDGWFSDANAYVTARFGADSAKAALWARDSNGGSVQHERHMIGENPYVGYVTLYRKSLEYLQGLPSEVVPPVPPLADGASPLQKFVDGIIGSIRYAYNRSGAVGVLVVILVAIAILAITYTKPFAETFDVLARFVRTEAPKASAPPPAKPARPAP